MLGYLEYSCVGLFGDQADVHVHVRKISASTRSCGDHSRDMLCWEWYHLEIGAVNAVQCTYMY